MTALCTIGASPLGFFADDAVFIAARMTGPCAGQTPCTGLAGIREQLEFAVAMNICQTLREATVAGSVVTGQIESRTDIDRANGWSALSGPSSRRFRMTRSPSLPS